MMKKHRVPQLFQQYVKSSLPSQQVHAGDQAVLPGCLQRASLVPSVPLLTKRTPQKHFCFRTDQALCINQGGTLSLHNTQTCEKRDGVSVSVINQDAKDAISAADAEKDGDVSSLAGSYFSTCRN